MVEVFVLDFLISVQYIFHCMYHNKNFDHHQQLKLNRNTDYQSNHTLNYMSSSEYTQCCEPG